MYEFVDVHGERVTVRSVRTLGGLLQCGTIVATTPFRRAEDASFAPAAKHPELLAIAAQLGVPLDGSRDVAARGPTLSPPHAAANSATLPTSTPLVSPAAKPSTPPAGVPSTTPSPPPLGKAQPIFRRQQPAAAATLARSARSPWSRRIPAARRRPSAEILAESTGIVLLNLASAAVLGVVARFVVSDATGSKPFAMTSPMAFTTLAGNYAGRVMANRFPRPTRWAVSLAAALFGLGCYELDGSVGLITAVAASIALWVGLSRPVG